MIEADKNVDIKFSAKLFPKIILVSGNSFQLVDLYLIYSGHKISGLYIRSQILFQHFARPNDNGNVGVVYTTYIVRSYIIFIGPLVLHTFFIRIHNCFVCINQNTSNISLNTAAACIEIVEMTFFKNERISSHCRDLSSVLGQEMGKL